MRQNIWLHIDNKKEAYYFVKFWYPSGIIREIKNAKRSFPTFIHLIKHHAKKDKKISIH